MDIKLYALIKAMVKSMTKGDKGDKGDKGESGYPAIVSIGNPPEGFSLCNNTEHHITFTDVLSCTIDFSMNYDGTTADSTRAGQIVAIFTVPETAKDISFPADVVWSASRPYWVIGKTYMLSFVPYNDKIIGVWAEVD